MYSKCQIAINFRSTTFLEAKDHLYLHINAPQGKSLHKTSASDGWLATRCTKDDFCGKNPQHSAKKGLVRESALTQVVRVDSRLGSRGHLWGLSEPTPQSNAKLDIRFWHLKSWELFSTR